MFVLEKDIGDVISMSTAGVETRISVLESNGKKVKLAIEAPADAQVFHHKPDKKTTEQELKENYKHELLWY